MIVLLDFSAIRGGGGAQLAINFLTKISATSFVDDNCIFLLPDTGPLSDIKLHLQLRGTVYLVPQEIISRMLFEYITLQRILKIKQVDVIFTFFGSGLPHHKSIPSVVSVAYPVICYPESPFWIYLPKLHSVNLKIKNILRCLRLKLATHILTETNVMKKRISEQLDRPENSINVISPAVTDFISGNKKNLTKHARKFLLLSGNAPHKNLWRLYDVALELKKLNFNEFNFIISVTRESWMSNLKKTVNIDENVIDSHFQFVGSISPQKIAQVYDSADVLISLSDLESFSNNYMEAWKAGIPLIVSKRDFAMNICKDSAIYVEPHDPENVAQAIIRISDDITLRNKLVANGKKRLAELPDFKERWEEVYNILTNTTQTYL